MAPNIDVLLRRVKIRLHERGAFSISLVEPRTPYPVPSQSLSVHTPDLRVHVSAPVKDVGTNDLITAAAMLIAEVQRRETEQEGGAHAP